MRLMFVIFFVFGALARRSLAHQTGCGCESGTLSLAKDVKKNTALVGHVFKNLSVQDGRECFQHCGKDCLCLSFNFKPKYREGNCELNDANSIVDPGGLAQAHDIEYYEPRRSYNEGASGACTGACRNGCCKSNPCLNSGTCREVCDPNKRRFNCTCPADRGGHKCQVKLYRTCKDLLRDGIATNGVQTLYDGNNLPFKAFCDFQSESGAAWTLVLSHALSNVADFKDQLYLDFQPINVEAPEWAAYRMAKSRMLSIRQKSTHWRATCNFPTDGVDFRDYLRASLGDFDIMASSTTQCRPYELVNIRGLSCTDCTAYTFYDNEYALHVDSYRSKSKGCNFDGSAGAVSSEDNFGNYGKTNPAFRCSASPSSTTQFWIGTK